MLLPMPNRLVGFATFPSGSMLLIKAYGAILPVTTDATRYTYPNPLADTSRDGRHVNTSEGRLEVLGFVGLKVCPVISVFFTRVIVSAIYCALAFLH